jgi:hypothetical protein
MVPFLFTVAVLGALFVVGYRGSLYLYSQGAMGRRSAHRTPIVAVKSLPQEVVLDRPVRARNIDTMVAPVEGMRYARFAMLVMAAGVAVVTIVIASIIANVLH